MIPSIEPLSRISSKRKTLWLVGKPADLEELPFTQQELHYARSRQKKDRDHVVFDHLGNLRILVFMKTGKDLNWRMEQARLSGEEARKVLKSYHSDEVQLIHYGDLTEEALAFAEGLVLGSYEFNKYRTEKDAGTAKLERVLVRITDVDDEKVQMLHNLLTAVAWARDLINEPLNGLNAEKLAEEARSWMTKAGARAEVLNKKRIEALKMGGILAVNRGSVDPPTFSILEWKPKNAVNEKPIILVGKGVVYDTGGLSLKPSNYMDTMKSDMSGAAAVAAVTYAVAVNKLPVHLITLIPATDNRPDGNAYVPGDVIKMYDGSTVEVLNTDAEGRMILADALSYAKKYDPELVVNVATLTGSAQRATGKHAMVAMQAGARIWMGQLVKSGDYTCERLVEFPMYEEYADMLKSEIADVKNIGGSEAGAITAGKFLERFTDYPFIHLDIAGTAFAGKRFNYRGIGGTGSTVRLLYHFLKNQAEK